MGKAEHNDIKTLAAMATKAFAEVGVLTGNNQWQHDGAQPTIKGFMLFADTMLAELSVWASMAPSMAIASPHIAATIASAYKIACWGETICDEVANAFYVEHIAELKRLKTTARKLTASRFAPELLVHMVEGCDEQAELRMYKLRACLGNTLKMVAEMLKMVARAAEMPKVPHPSRVAEWAGRLLDAIHAQQALHAEEYELDVDRQIKRGKARRQALEYLAKYRSDCLALIPMGKEAAEASIDGLDDFVVKLRTLSVSSAKEKPNIDELIAHIAAHRWAVRQLALLDSPSTTTTIINVENKMEIKNCTIGQVNEGYGANINHGTQNFGCNEEKRTPQYTEAEVVDEEVDGDLGGEPLSPEENARIWAKSHFREIGTIYGSPEALARKVANICKLYEEEKAKHDEGDRWRTSYLKSLFYPNDPNSQWLKDTSMSFETFSELIRDERVGKSIFSKTKSNYKYLR